MVTKWRKHCIEILTGATACLVGIAAIPAIELPGPPSPPGAPVNTRLVGASWWQTVTAEIARAEYAASPTSSGLQAPNRAQNLRTYFHERGIEVVPREGDAVPAWRFAWETVRFGRSGALRAVETTSPEPDGSRITYRRAEFEEWYSNSSDGLEQGYTVYAPPPGEGPLCLIGRLACPLQAELSAADGAANFFDEHGARVLRYGELRVRDAQGDEVPSCLSLDGMELAILVEDGGAAYPLTVDPLMTSPAWSAESDQYDARFSSSVATAGDVNGDGYSDVIVGAPFYDNGQIDEGRVFVYHGSAPAGRHTGFQ